MLGTTTDAFKDINKNVQKNDKLSELLKRLSHEHLREVTIFRTIAVSSLKKHLTTTKLAKQQLQRKLNSYCFY